MSDDSIVIPLSKGLSAIIDASDYNLVAPFKWYAQKGRGTWYARHDYFAEDGRKINLYMHQLLCDASPVDHRDRNGLNNRRSNLRPCSESQNQANRTKMLGTTSPYKGVTYDKNRDTWSAGITKDGRRISLGRSDDEELLAARYDVAARILFGEFATSNLGVSLDQL